MRKVLVIGNRVPLPARDGGALATLQLLKLYSAAGFKVDFITLNTSKHFVNKDVINKEFQFLNFIQTVEINTDLSFKGMLLNLLSSKKSYNLARFYSTTFENCIIEKLTSSQYDFIHIESLYAATVLPKIKQYFQGLIYIRVHNIEHQIWQRVCKNEKNLLKKIYLKIMTKRLKSEELYLLAQADSLLNISMVDLNYFKRVLPETKQQYLPFAVEGSIPNNTKQNVNNSVGFIGSMEWLPNKRGLNWFIDEVWSLVLGKVPNASLKIAGKRIGEQLSTDLSKGIEIIGEVESAKDFMQGQAILIVPLFSGSGIRIKTIEAMSFGVPVVSTSVGAQGLAIKDKYNVLIADSKEDFANAVINLLINKEFRNVISKNALSYVNQNHSEQKVIEILKNL